MGPRLRRSFTALRNLHFWKECFPKQRQHACAKRQERSEQPHSLLNLKHRALPSGVLLDFPHCRPDIWSSFAAALAFATLPMTQPRHPCKIGHVHRILDLTQGERDDKVCSQNLRGITRFFKSSTQVFALAITNVAIRGCAKLLLVAQHKRPCGTLTSSTPKSRNCRAQDMVRQHTETIHAIVRNPSSSGVPRLHEIPSQADATTAKPKLFWRPRWNCGRAAGLDAQHSRGRIDDGTV